MIITIIIIIIIIIQTKLFNSPFLKFAQAQMQQANIATFGSPSAVRAWAQVSFRERMSFRSPFRQDRVEVIYTVYMLELPPTQQESPPGFFHF